MKSWRPTPMVSGFSRSLSSVLYTWGYRLWMAFKADSVHKAFLWSIWKKKWRGLTRLDPTAGRSLRTSMLCSFKWSAGPMPLSIKTWGDPNGPGLKIISFLVRTVILLALLLVPVRVTRWTPRARYGHPLTLSCCSTCIFSTMILVAMWRLSRLWRARSLGRKAW